MTRTGEKMETRDPDSNGKDAVVRGANLHAVVIPHPAFGHITPTLQLAKKLAALGFRITFVNTIFGERMMKSRSKAMEPHEGIKFLSVSDGLPDEFPRFRDFHQHMDALLAMGPAIEELLANLLRESPITCVIYDFRFPAVHEPAKRAGIPVVGARSEDEAAARQLAPLTLHIPGVSPTLRVEDIPTYMLSSDIDHWYWHSLREIHIPLLLDCECILFNTFHDLEGDVLDAMSGHLNSIVYGVGPLILSSSDVAIAGSAGSAVREEDAVTISWLDTRNPNSVLLVSFGSIATISVGQMKEFALGLEMSGHAFLWVIRQDAIENLCEVDKEFETFFSGFLARTRDRARLVPWVPQTAVLAHPSVGAFLTHCGWNSTIESISSGVPMLGWPRFADQTTNCHYITDVWKIGLRLQGDDTLEDTAGGTIVLKEEVDRKVRKLMTKEGVDPEVDQMRANSIKLQMTAKKAVAGLGSSQLALAKFVELVESWRTKHSTPPNS